MANSDIHIGFDMDGVLVDHTEWKQILARRYGYTLTAAQTTSDAMRAIVADEHRSEIQRLLYQDDRYALSPALMPGARELLEELTHTGIRFSLISRRRDHDLARLLLEKHRLRPVFFSDVNTVFVGSVQEKADACARLGVTHYIDDEVQVLRALQSVPHRYLMDPHAQAPVGNWHAVSTLAEFRARIVPHD